MLNNLEKQFVAYLFRLKAEGVLKKAEQFKRFKSKCFKDNNVFQKCW